MILYAPSMAGLVHSLKVRKSDELHVWSTNRAVISFCKENKITITTLNFKYQNIKSLIHIKKEIDKRVKQFKNQEFLFCFNGVDVLGLYMMIQLEKNNNVYFENRDHEYDTTSVIKLFRKKPIYILDYLSLITVLKIPIKIFDLGGGRMIYGIKSKWLESKMNKLPANVDEEIFASNKMNFQIKYGVEENAVFFLDVGNDLYCVDEEIISLIEKIADGNKIYLKRHPNFELSTSKLLKFEEIEKNIPVELILNSSMTIIGVCTSTLFDKNINCKKLTLFDRVNWNSLEMKETLRKKLFKVNHQIEFL